MSGGPGRCGPRDSEPERATRLLGAADAIRDDVGLADPQLRARSDVRGRNLAAALDLLGPNRFAMLWADGRRRSLEQAVAYATVRTAVPPSSSTSA